MADGISGMARQRGFTLLEALLALVIVSISLGVLYQVVSGSLQLGFRARDNYIAAVQARLAFEESVPADLTRDDVVWSNSTDTFSWTLEIHPVALRDSFEESGLTSTADLIKVVFLYSDLSTGRKFRFSSFRRVQQDSLQLFLKENEDHLVWDEYDQFAGYISQ